MTPTLLQHSPTRKTGQTLLVVGLLAAAGLLSVATSSPRPAIVAVSPGLGSSSVAVDQALDIQFDEPVDQDTVSGSTISLVRRADSLEIRGTFSFTEGDRRVIFTPFENLAPDTDYTLALDLGRLRSKDGETFSGLRYDARSSEVWETAGVLHIPFTTRRNLSVARAFVKPGAEDILVYFSEPVEPASVTRENVSLIDGSGEEVSIDLRYSELDNRLRIVPLSPLAPGSEYTLTLDGDIRAVAGAGLAGGVGDALTFEISEERIR